MNIRKLALAAVIAAIYASLTIGLAPISYGAFQCRVSEALCILPFFFPFSVWGLFVGCLIANIIGPYGLPDIVFGSLATLIAGLCTLGLGKISRDRLPVKFLACLPPVIVNGVIVGAVIAYSSAPDAFWAAFLINAAWIALGEFAALYALGFPLMIYLPKTHVFKKLAIQYMQ